MKQTKRPHLSSLALLLLLSVFMLFFAFTASAETIGGDCGAQGDNVRWTLDTETGVLTISGEGAMEEDPWVHWRAYDEEIRELVIEDGVTYIGKSSFSNLQALESATISNSVTTIRTHAFSDSRSLKTVTLPDGLTQIQGHTFENCQSLESINIPASVTSIDDCAFLYCQSLTSLELPAGLTHLGVLSLANCTSLESLVIPEGITELPDYAISGNTSLRSLQLPDGLRTIENFVLTLNDLETVIIPNSVESIGALSLVGTQTKTIQLGPNLKSIGYCALNTDIAPIFGIDTEDVQLETIRICMTQEEWERSVTEVPMTTEEFSRYTGVLLDEMPDLGIFPQDVEVLFDAHVPGEPVRENVVAGNCTTTGHYDEVTYCTLCGREAGRRTVYGDDAPGHDFDLTWTWANDGSLATVEGTCARCGLTVLQRGEISRAQQADGSIVCMASVVVDGVTYTDTKTVAPSGNNTDPGTNPGTDPGTNPGTNPGTDPGTNPGPGTDPGDHGAAPEHNAPESRCRMCNFYEEYRSVPVAGWIVSIVHFFIHLTTQLKAV